MMRFKVFSLGCKLNHYEAEFLREEFLSYGWEESERANLFIVNTCALTSMAERKSLKLIRKLKRENPQAQIIATGCLAEINPSPLMNISDCVFSHSDKPLLVRKILQKSKEGKEGGIWEIKISGFSQKRAFLKVQDGCNKHCTFCISRLARGRSTSRPPGAIKEELGRLIDKGFYEIVLVGLDLGSWRSQKYKKGLNDLLEELTRMRGLGRLRLSSLNPKDVKDELLELVSKNDKICPHLHLSFQSADSRVLRDMGREYTQEDCFKLAEKIRRKSPYLGVSCDIMFGFPSETEGAFENSLRLLEILLPVKVHIFKFSPRPLTPAASLSYPISAAALQKRKERLFALSQQLSYRFRQLNQGRVLEVVLDKEKENCGEGYSDNYIRIKTSLPKTKFNLGVVKAEIKKVTPEETWASLI